MNKLFKTFSEHKLIILITLFLVLVLSLSFWLQKVRNKYYLIAKFSDSGPLYKNMPVYYKGYLIGQIKKIKISADYNYSTAQIEFYPEDPKFYDNIVAKAKKLEEEDDYIDLIYPDPPSTTLLKKGSYIEGKGAFDIDLLLSDVADAEILVPLLQNFSDVLASADKTSKEIKNFFSDSRIILKDNKQNIKQTTENLELSTKSIKRITSKFNNSINSDQIKNTASNVDKVSTNILTATESIKNITGNVDCATKNLDKTVAKIDCTISEVNKIATNMKEITSGLCETLGKRFAGFRIIFGKPINKNKCPNKCCK